MQKQRVLNKNAEAYIEWFQLYERIIAKWGILLKDIWNMDESGAVMGQKYYTRVIVPAFEKDAIFPTDKSREWGTLIETINAIGKALKIFFIMKGESVLE